MDMTRFLQAVIALLAVCLAAALLVRALGYY
jgi:hypothetical protein